MIRSANAAVLVVCAALAVMACGNPIDGEKTADPAAQDTSSKAPAPQVVRPPFTVAGEGEGLMMTWFDGEGLHTAQRRSDIPEAHRAQVRVASLAADPAHRLDPEYVYVADMRAESGGGYPVVKMGRAQFESLASAAREAARPATGDVVVYSASWCGACKAAKRFLDQQGVPYTDRDVEKDPGASAEMQRKARAAGKTPRGVPVIDFDGEIILGFDQARLQQLIAKR